MSLGLKPLNAQVLTDIRSVSPTKTMPVCWYHLKYADGQYAKTILWTLVKGAHYLYGTTASKV